MQHPLFLQVAATQGMRELLAARVYAQLRPLGVRVRVEHDGVLRITIWLQWWAWFCFGVIHLAYWYAVRSVARAQMQALKIHAETKVRIR